MIYIKLSDKTFYDKFFGKIKLLDGLSFNDLNDKINDKIKKNIHL